MIQKLLLLVLLLSYGAAVMAQQKSGTYTVQSPDGKITATVDLKDKIIYTVSHEEDVVIAPSPISLQVKNAHPPPEK